MAVWSAAKLRKEPINIRQFCVNQSYKLNGTLSGSKGEKLMNFNVVLKIRFIHFQSKPTSGNAFIKCM